MDFDQDLINNFATILPKRAIQKSLYCKNKLVNIDSSRKQYKASDIVANVTKQLKAIQDADNIKKRKQKQNPISNFETQCVTDTQLINIIKNVEEIEGVEMDITQEFNTTFCHKDFTNVVIQTKKVFSKEEDINEVPAIFSHHNRQIEIPYKSQYTNKDAVFETNTFKPIVISAKENFDQFINNSNGNNKVNVDIMNIQSLNDEVCCDSDVQIIYRNNKVKYGNSSTEGQIGENKKSNSNMNCEIEANTSPLVFKLESFEKFESIALPVILENPDFEVAKRLVNFQMDRELYIQSHAEPVPSERDKQLSPILEMKNKNGHTLEFNRNILSQTEISPVIDDGILFSSDEEDNVQKKLELPLTCVLQPYSNNEPNILDKTIYVGFQTASNKSIQVLSDSFNKAKNMFHNIVENDDDDLSLRRLVEVYDTSNCESDINSIDIVTNHCGKNETKNLNKVRSSDIDQNDTKSNVISLKCEDNNCIPSSKGSCDTESTENVSINSNPVKFKKHLTCLENNNFIPSIMEKKLHNTVEVNKNYSSDIEIESTDFNRKPVVELKMMKYRGLKISKQVPKTKNDISPKNKRPNGILSDTGLVEFKTGSMFQGFKTASNKPVKITEKSLAITKNIFNDIDFENIEESKIMHNLNDVSKENVSYNSNRRLLKSAQGFMTKGSNETGLSEKLSIETIKKNINVSDKSGKTNDNVNIIVKEENLKYRVSREDTVTDSLLLGFKTRNKTVKTCTKALEKTRYISKDLFTSDCIQEKDDICNEKLPYPLLHSKTSAILQNEEMRNKLQEREKEKIQENPFGITNNKFINDAKENQSKHSEITTSNYMFQSFRTANDKPVIISTDALAKSKKLFQDIDMSFEEQKCNYLEINEIKTRTQNNFKGFQTASNKEVKISENALLKSKKIFEGMDLERSSCHLECSKKLTDMGACDIDGKSISTLGFVTGNNNHIKISDEALLKTGKLFTDIIETKVFVHSKDICEIDVIPENKVEDFIFDTEFINDFENTVYTEDFVLETPKSKRPGSPILSCPKAKKKKNFETPLNNNKFIAPVNIKTTITSNCVFKFTENYKKTKKYSIKDINEIDQVDSDVKIDQYITNFQFPTLLDFQFIGPRNDINRGIWTTDKIVRQFRESVNTKIIPEGWMENHLRLIIWKLLSYEIRFPKSMKNICTVKNVLDQLKFRYDRELYNVERPALRKILEKDEVSTRRMILCVAGLFVDGLSVTSVSYGNQNIELLLTDGWYCIKACTDRMIDQLICNGKITVGTKLIIHGAELLNCDQGISPWEDTSSVRLKISGNSTRRAKWYARLGFCGNGAILTHLSNVKPEGGKISHLRILVTRVYPMLYIEKFADGSTVTHSERLEHLYQMKYETERQIQIEKLYEEVEKFSDQESQDSEDLYCDEKGLFGSGSQISRLLKKSKDMEHFRAILTSSQAHRLQKHTIKIEEKRMHHLQEKVQELMKKRGLDVARNVVPLMKIRVADVENGKISNAMLTIWRPNEMLQELITEGTWIDLYNVVPTAVRYSEIQISAGRQSVFIPLKIKDTHKLETYKKTLKRKCYTIKDLQNSSINTDYNEVDTVGLIFLIEPTTDEFEKNNQQFQNMYLSDADKNVLCVNFWGGIKKYGFENTLEKGHVITCANLQKRAGNTKKNIPQYRATEFSFFTKTSKNDSVRKLANYLTEKFSRLDKLKFIDDCVAIKNKYQNIKYGNIENISPYRMNNLDYNISRNKAFIESPLVNKNGDVGINLTGLDFESTFKQSDTQQLSPTILIRKKKVTEKIAKLEMYGEPPPLAKIHIINKSSDAGKPFRSPFTKIDIPASVTSVNIMAKNREECLNSSPILPLNRTYVKKPSVNPVKLDFSRVIEDELVLDAFAEDFDGSQPLSLDSVL